MRQTALIIEMRLIFYSAILSVYNKHQTEFIGNFKEDHLKNFSGCDHCFKYIQISMFI